MMRRVYLLKWLDHLFTNSEDEIVPEMTCRCCGITYDEANKRNLYCPCEKEFHGGIHCPQAKKEVYR